jgi:hypothetical protein
MKTYLVMADALLYIDAESPEDAEQKAELAESSEWEIDNFSACEENSYDL